MKGKVTSPRQHSHSLGEVGFAGEDQECSMTLVQHTEAGFPPEKAIQIGVMDILQ